MVRISFDMLSTWYHLIFLYMLLSELRLKIVFWSELCKIREVRSLHGWKRYTRRDSSPLAPSTTPPRKTKRISAVWIAAQAFVLTAFSPIDPTGFFRFVATFIMRLSDWRTSRSSWTAQIFRFNFQTIIDHQCQFSFGISHEFKI